MEHSETSACYFLCVSKQAKLLKGVRAKLDEWDSIGHCIILVTARKKALENTEKHSKSLQFHMTN